MSWARVGIFLLEASRERKRLRRTAEAIGLSLFYSDTFEALKNLKPDATTAFILGTGASAADLSAEKLAYIESQFSIGVNQWILHPMVPDVYAYEVDPDVRLLQELDRPQVREKSPLLLFLKPSKREDFPNARFVPDFMKERSYLYSRVNIWTRKERNIARDFVRVTCLLGRLERGDILLDNGATIARMMALVVALGFRRIVLVGVDLDNVDYFWHRAPHLIPVLDGGEFVSGQTGSTHETMTALSRPFPIDTYVFALNQGLGKHFEILVESQESSLARRLRIFSQ